jgi:hypothetical protein
VTYLNSCRKKFNLPNLANFILRLTSSKTYNSRNILVVKCLMDTISFILIIRIVYTYKNKYICEHRALFLTALELYSLCNITSVTTKCVFLWIGGLVYRRSDHVASQKDGRISLSLVFPLVIHMP